jgi:heme A synthase
VLCIWLTRRARGSLLPTTVLFAAYLAGPSIAAWTSSSASRESSAYQLYLVGFIIAAALFVVAGRMWRRPEAAPTPPALDLSRPPAPGGYEVVVRDVDMPF